jgi:uncharacterized protein
METMMALNKALMDSSFLYALFEENNPRHEVTLTATKNNIFRPVVPYVVLSEVAFLFNRAGGVPATLKFLDSLVRFDCDFEVVTVADLIRAREIMALYASARFDFVDSCLMALSERLNVTDVCTLDRRDFQIFRPKHCDYLTLLP